GGAVVEGPATTGEVQLVGDHVLPEADDGGTEVLVPGLQHVVGHPGEQVVGAHCVPGGDRLVLHRVDVLVVVPTGAALPAVQVQQPAGQGEVRLLPGAAVQLDHGHVVRGADVAVPDRLRLLMHRLQQVVGRPQRHGEVGVLPGEPPVQAAEGDQVAQVVGLEVQPVLQRGDAGVAAGTDRG